MSAQKDLVKNTIIIAAGKLSTQFLSFLLLPVYTTFLTTEAFGTVDLIMTYVAISIPLIAISVERAVFRHLIDVRKDPEGQRRIISNAVMIYLMGIIAFTGVFALVDYIITVPYGWLVYGVIVAMSLSNLLMQVSRGLGDNIKFSIASVVAGLSTIALNLVLIVGLGWGGEGMLVATAVGNVLCGMYLALALRIPGKIDRKLRDVSLQKQLLGYSAPLVPSNIAWWAISAVDRTIIAIVLGPVANGIYAAAHKFPQVFSGLFSFFSMSWQESASVHINSKSRDKFYSQTMDATIRLFGALGICIVAATGLFFDVLVGSAFHDARQYIPVLILGVFFSAILDIYSGVYIAKKMTNQVFKTSAIAAVINIAFTVSTINYLGLYAPAIAMCIAYLSMSVLRHFDLRKHVNISYKLTTIMYVAMFAGATASLYYMDTVCANLAAVAVAVVAMCVLNRQLITGVWRQAIKKLRKK